MKILRRLGLALVLVLIVLVAMIGTMRAGYWNSDYNAVKAKYAAAPSRFVALEGAELHFRDEGQGRAVVLLHGSATSLHEWDFVVDQLKSRYRVIRFDWPPYGLSTDSTGVYSSPRAAQLLAALVDHLKLDKFVLVATSNGGNVALSYAEDHQDRLAGMAFSVLPIKPLVPDKPPSMRVKFMTWFFPTFTPDYHPEWFYRVVYEEVTAPGFKVQQDYLEAVHQQNNLPGATARAAQYLAANREIFKHGDAGAAAENIKVPVLLQWCDLDTVIVPKTRGDEAAARFKQAPVKLIHYPDIGHYPMLEQPARYLQDLEAFIDQLPDAR